MAVGVFMEFPGVTRDQYEQLVQDTYSHVIPHMQRDAMGRFGKMFAKPS